MCHVRRWLSRLVPAAVIGLLVIAMVAMHYFWSPVSQTIQSSIPGLSWINQSFSRGLVFDMASTGSKHNDFRPALPSLTNRAMVMVLMLATLVACFGALIWEADRVYRSNNLLTGKQLIVILSQMACCILLASLYVVELASQGLSTTCWQSGWCG